MYLVKSGLLEGKVLDLMRSTKSVTFKFTTTIPCEEDDELVATMPLERYEELRKRFANQGLSVGEEFNYHLLVDLDKFKSPPHGRDEQGCDGIFVLHYAKIPLEAISVNISKYGYGLLGFFKKELWFDAALVSWKNKNKH